MNRLALLSSSAAFAGCLVSIPFICALARKLGLYDPVGPLKIHTKAIPRVGGVAMVIGLVSGLAAGYRLLDIRMIGFCVALAMLFLVGIIDDLHDISPRIRLLVQAGAAFALWWGSGRCAILGMPVLGFVAECLFILILVNAFNLLDGADGIAAGVAVILGLGFLLVERSSSALLVSAVLLGSCLGFLIFNFPPAKIFMGDSGSTTLGFLIAYMSLEYYRSLPITDSGHLIPLLFAALPLLDMLYAVTRRVRSGMSIMQGDRRHCFDLLLRRGWPARMVAFCCYITSAATVFLGWMCQGQGWLYTCLIAVFVFAVSTLLAANLGSLRGEPVTAGASLSRDASHQSSTAKGMAAGIRPDQVLLAPMGPSETATTD